MRRFSKQAGAKRRAFHRLVLSVLFLWLGACGAASPQPATTPSTTVAAAPPAATSEKREAGHKSFLWEVSAGTQKAYLLGSIHVAKQELYPLSPAIEQAYEKSDALVLEVYLTKEVEAEVALKSAKLGLYPEGDSIDKHVSPETWTRYSTFLEAQGKPVAVFARMKPWLASVALMMDSLGESGFAPDQGIDRYFQDRAEKDHKPIKSLETVDDQLDSLANIDDSTQELMLLEFLDSHDDVGKQLDEAFEAWQRGDAATMEATMLASLEAPQYRPLFDKLFVERNLRMKAKLSEYLAGTGTHFVVVGSGHLVGKQGLVELFRRDQLRVEQL